MTPVQANCFDDKETGDGEATRCCENRQPMGTHRVSVQVAAPPPEHRLGPGVRWSVRAFARGVLLALVIGGIAAGCDVLPTPILNGDMIVLQVTNSSPRPIPLTVAMPGDERRVVGSVDPPVVPPGTTVMARFLVPRTGQWAIFANGGEMMGSFDLKARRGNLPMGIDISSDGSQGWWCTEACP
jgi:hypothetical protein